MVSIIKEIKKDIILLKLIKMMLINNHHPTQLPMRTQMQLPKPMLMLDQMETQEKAQLT